MRRFEMDHTTKFSFYAHLSIYPRIAGYLCAGSTILALLLAQMRLIYPATWLTVAALTSLGFTVWVTWCYKMYLHSKYPLNAPRSGPSNYTTAHCIITYTLAIVAWWSSACGLMGMILGMLER